MYLNLSIVFLVCGIWHGAGWNFVIWGIWHGLFIVGDKLFLNRAFKRVPKILRVALTFLVVTLGWIFFRLENLSDACFFLGRCFSLQHSRVFVSNEFITFLLTAIVFSFLTLTPWGKKLESACYAEQRPEWQHYLSFLGAVVLIVACTAYLYSSSFNPFIYFRF